MPVPIPDEIRRERVMVPTTQPAGITDADFAVYQNQIADLQATAAVEAAAVASGAYYGPMHTLDGWTGGLTNIALTQNRLYASPWRNSFDLSFQSVRLEVATAVSGATIRLGLFAKSSAGLPDAQVDDYGTIDASTTGGKTILITETYGRGFCWLGCACSHAGVSVKGVPYGPGLTAIAGYADPSGTVPISSFYRTTALANGFTALPATFGAVTLTSFIPAISIRST